MKWINRKNLCAATVSVMLMMTSGAYAKTEIQSKAKQTKPVATQNVKHSSININKASAEQLAGLKGIGKAKAKAIIDYRTKHGKFRSVESLTAVPGIGEVIVEQNRSQLKL